MTAAATVREPRRGAARLPWGWVVHLAAGGVVAAGLVSAAVRPRAPAIGQLPPVSDLFGQDYLAAVAAYRGPGRIAGLLALGLGIAVPVAAAVTPLGRGLLGRVAGVALGRGFRQGGDGLGRDGPMAWWRLGLAGALVGLAVTVATDLVTLPIAYWSGYVHEGRWGFRTQGLAGWSRDWLVGRAPGWLAVAALASGGMVLVRRLPRSWPPAAGLAAAALSAVLAFVAPAVLEPLEFRFSPLPPGPVRTEVERVLAAADQPVTAILVADASRRTTKVNAYISGLGASRHVVLYDTLIAQRSAPEVGAVLAHELGHQRNGDVGRNVALAGAGAVAAAYGLAGLMAVAARRGSLRGPTDPQAVALALAVLAVGSLVGRPLLTAVSRQAEDAADAASLELTSDPETFVAMQRGLATANLGDPAPPPWAEALWGTHPSARHRITLGQRWERIRQRAPDP